MPKVPPPTPDIRESIAATVRLNVPPEVAAIAAGVSAGDFWRWMTRGQNERRGACREFYLAIQRAETDRQKLTLAEIIQIGRGGQVVRRRKTVTTRKNGETLETIDETITPPQWTALAWLLERRWPQWWARNAKDDDQTNISDKELHELLLDLTKGEPGGTGVSPVSSEEVASGGTGVPPVSSPGSTRKRASRKLAATKGATASNPQCTGETPVPP